MGRIKKIKQTTHQVLHTGVETTSFIYFIDDYIISGLIVMNVIAIILESLDFIYNPYRPYFYAFELFSVIVFSIEYILRIWVADLRWPEMHPFWARVRYIFSFLGLVDLMAILPFYLPMFIAIDLRFLRMLRLLRLFRVFKLAHYSESIRMIGTVIRKKKRELLITVLATFMIILVTATLMYEIEHKVQPDKFPNVPAAFWWAVATLTTIGYGDVVPVTGWGQFLAAMTAIFGIGLVAIPTGILSMGFMEELDKRKREKSGEYDEDEYDPESASDHEECDFEYCPYCGKKLKK
ncbi:MAG: ion transporter [Candidatus Kapaibacterium sp.]